MPKMCSFIILAIVITLCPGTVLLLFPSPVEALAPYLPSTQQKDNRTSRNIQTYLSLVGDPSVHRAIPRNRRKRTLDHDAHNYPSSYNIKGLRLALKNANRNDDLGATTITTTNNNSSRRHLSKHKIILAKAAVVYLTSCILLAKLNLIGSDYTNLLIAKDFGVSLLTTILALFFVKTITKLAAEGILQARDSRKIIHMFSAPLFILFWPLFSDVWGARLFAAFVPALQALRLWFAGTGTSSSSSSGDDGDVELNEMDDSTELANAISRSGDRQEALGGPFIYVVILFSAILLCFRDNLSGVVALSTMAAGDGMADIVGRRFGRNNKWFLNENKSVAGSVGFVVAASLCSTGLAAWLMYTHAVTIGLSMGVVVSRIVLISILSALVEILPGTDDNWSVPITAGVLSSLLID